MLNHLVMTMAIVLFLSFFSYSNLYFLYPAYSLYIIKGLSLFDCLIFCLEWRLTALFSAVKEFLFPLYIACFVSLIFFVS
ncbi:hypothetical protein VNO78_15141 [Psophocarpus tetragonolobus]|uniref:Uncharacterized protein n=1 Tax=Psophocarpus tetragonolobus TaxID=3891 RepID=A0AAN9SFG1_PSOTE